METIEQNQISNHNSEQISFVYFEFYSGIGGMHTAISHLKLPIIAIYPFDINPNANKTYFHNYGIKPIEKSIESITVQEYDNYIQSLNSLNLKIIWTMSPPCQPYTRQGKEKGLDDSRSNSFKHLMNILTKTKYKPDYFLLENVKGFESSEANILLKATLSSNNFHFIQFLICPTAFNIPNSRLRFYCIAKKDQFVNIIEDIKNLEIVDNSLVKDLFTEDIFPSKCIGDFLNLNPEENLNDYYLPKDLLEKESAFAFDVVNMKSKSTNCFTKNYSRLIKGSGSLLLIDDQIDITNLDIKGCNGKLRYFTPKEIQTFLFFDENFNFPEEVGIKAQYKLLGNSLNAKVVEILVKFLFNH